MHKVNISEVPSRQRNGLTSYILLQHEDIPGSNLSVTWVNIAKGSSQKPHSHYPEQSYIIIHGQGNIFIGNERTSVEKGDLVYIPSNVIHYIENTGDNSLIYISTATPSYNFTNMYDAGDLS
ncbi:MAG: cupin domain-containing protein [Desulfovermiculus sp.]|nr:cupin domain-containing protein [Desulfovermiculus sp.]